MSGRRDVRVEDAEQVRLERLAELSADRLVDALEVPEPALLTSTSSRPPCRAHGLDEALLVLLDAARPPRSRAMESLSFAKRASAVGSTPPCGPDRKTAKPSAARRRTIAAPIPRVPPVTRATGLQP